MEEIKSHRELRVYGKAFEVAMHIFENTHHSLDQDYENIIGMLVTIQKYSEKWAI